MEVLTIVSALAFLALVLAMGCFAAERQRVYASASTVLGTLAVGCTLAVHVVQLTAVRQLWRIGARTDYRLIWPSELFAVEYLAWDLLVGLTLVLASFVFLGTRASPLARFALMTSGLLCIVGLAGPISGSMIWQNVAVLGYAILLPIAAVLVGRVFMSTPPHGSIAQ